MTRTQAELKAMAWLKQSRDFTAQQNVIRLANALLAAESEGYRAGIKDAMDAIAERHEQRKAMAS